MSSKSLSLLMRIAVISVTFCGLLLCFYIIPAWGHDIIVANPEFKHWFWPWLTFAWAFALPWFVVLSLVWKVSGAVKAETVFSFKSARWVKQGALWLLSDAVLLVVGNFVLLLTQMNHGGILLLAMILAIMMFGLGLLAAVLARYLTKASVMQEESEGTL